jgi:hypothetical protein
MSEEISRTNGRSTINPAIVNLVKLLARFAVEDYLKEIGYASPSRTINCTKKYDRTKKEITKPEGEK